MKLLEEVNKKKEQQGSWWGLIEGRERQSGKNHVILFPYINKKTIHYFLGFKIRADSEDVGFCETFRVYCQARFKRKARQDKKKAKKEGSVNELDNM